MSTTQTFDANPPSFTNHAASSTPSAIDQQHRIEYTAVAASLGWSGWGSPVGLGIVLGALGFFLLCLHWAGFVH